MAKITFFDNVFDFKNSKTFSLDKSKSIKDFLNEEHITEYNYDALVEVYDPERGETSYLPLEDDITQDLVISATANGNSVSPDYFIKENDDIVIYALPASTQARESWGKGLAIVGSAIATIGGIISLFPGAQVVGGIVMGVGGVIGLVGSFIYMNNLDNNSTSSSNQNADSIPSLSGSSNQNLIDNPIPVVAGKTYATPYIVGSPYTELEYSDTFDESWMGTKTKMYMLLCLGYAPLAIDKILLNQLTFSKNPNNVLNGILSYKRGSDNEVLDDKGNVITFNGSTGKQEIESSWLTNKPRIEISQFGFNRSIYPYSVIQSNVNAAMLYCYDKEYSDIANESNLITWNGGKYPSGYRTTTIHFSESVPYKVVVGIDIPSGLYRQWSKTDGSVMVDKIPMNVVIQWRPHYKYVDKITSEAKSEGFGTEWVYTPTDYKTDYSARTSDYTEQRYKGWRNFNSSKIIPKIKYTSGSGSSTKYYVYAVDGKACVQNGYFGYYLNTTGPEESGTFFPCEKQKTLQECYNQLYNYLTSLQGGPLTGSPSIVINGVVCTPSVETRSGTFFAKGIQTAWFITESAESFASRFASACYENQATTWADKYENGYRTEIISLNPTSKYEIEMNAGLSEGTSKDCNPDWSGVECFSFGKVSGGWKMYEGYDDPSISTNTIEAKNPDDYQNEMQFEIEATLSQEDILDLINCNPMTNRSASQNINLAGYTDVETDCIEVRVIRLTPCYVDGDYNASNDSATQYTYSDVIKWNYLKSFTVDKNKLLDDIKYTEKSHTFAKINCNPNMFDVDTYTYTDEETGKEITVDVKTLMEEEKSIRWNQWEISNYYSTPLSDEDQKKVVTLGFEVYPDSLGNLTGNMDKINVVARAITPALKTEFIRYWYKKDGANYWYDSYDTLFSITSTVVDEKRVPIYDDLIPSFSDSSVQWEEEDENHLFDDDNPTVLDSTKDENLYWCLKNNAWDAKFYPEKIEQKKQLEISVDYNGDVNFNENGEPITTTVKDGNSWFDYIQIEMQRYRDSANRWILTQSMQETFTNQNAISQVLGLLCGMSLGKDSYGYNSTNYDKFIRYWYVNNDAYYYYDVDDINYTETHNPVFNENTWIESNKSFFEETESFEIGDDYYYSYREVLSSFNMLPLKESYLYTDKINIGNNFGELSYKYNKYITSQQKIQDLLSEVLTAGRAYWFYDENGRIEIRNDKPLSNPVLLITDENTLSNSNSRAFSRSIAGYHVTFQDEDNGNQTGELYVLRQGQTREKHTRDIKDISFTGVTNNKQAFSMAQYMLAQSICQRETWTRKLNHLGSVLTIGSLVEVQSSSLLIGTDYSGRVLQLIQDDKYVYGFISDKTYEYLAEYNDDGSNKQGCKIMQSTKDNKDRVITLRFANKQQQTGGISVENDGIITTYNNLPGQTNVILFEKKIVKESSQIEEVDTGTGVSSITEFDLQLGDIVAFGYVGKTTSLAVVYQITPDENGKFSVVMYPYNEAIYSCGVKYPSYNANITKKPLVDAARISDYEVSQQIREATESTSTDLQNQIEAVIEGTHESIEIPVIAATTAIVNKDGINFSCVVNNSGLSNSISEYTFKLSKDGGKNWQSLTSSSATYNYTFKRTIDGYPEADDFAAWKYKVSVKNLKGLLSEELEGVLNTDYYGTWKPGLPNVSVEVQDRVITLKLTQGVRSDNKEVYGNVRYKIQVRKNGETSWYKPATDKDPYVSPDNYKDGSGYVISNGTYSQVMPLNGDYENDVIVNLVSTAYDFRISAFTEGGESSFVEKTGVTALITSLRDIVKSKQTAKEEYVDHLSAISANFGVMQSGAIGDFTNVGTKGNYWALTTIKPSEYPEIGTTKTVPQGSFRVGGDNQYINVLPQTDTQGNVTDYEVEIKAGNIKFSTDRTYIYDSNDENIRLKLNANGIELQEKVIGSTGGDWLGGAKAKTIGFIQASSAIDESGIRYSHLTISNDVDIENDIIKGFTNAEAIIYHFENTVTDESGTDSKTLNLSSDNLDGTTGYINTNDAGCYKGNIQVPISEAVTEQIVALNNCSIIGINTDTSNVYDVESDTYYVDYNAISEKMGLSSKIFVRGE